MHLKTRNVNSAFRQLVNLFLDANAPYEEGEELFARRPYKNPNGEGYTVTLEEPITITYSHPTERVLFNSVRDANPFFHLYEALWMLAGRNDVASVAYYAKQMNQYSDDGVHLNGAYGRRWRHSYIDKRLIGQGMRWNEDGDLANIDQLQILISHLKANPNSRRAVLTMWNVEDDLLKIGGMFEPSNPPRSEGEYMALVEGVKVYDKGSKDVCCNLNVMFSLRNVSMSRASAKEQRLKYRRGADEINRNDDDTPTIVDYLDMTVTNRSNDMIWGCLGANYVHFTFLQEYMAAHLGVEVGKYHHFTNNLHVYDWNWKPEEWLADEQPDHYQNNELSQLPTDLAASLWGRDLRRVPLVKDPAVFDREVKEFVETYSGEDPNRKTKFCYDEPFLEKVAYPAMAAFYHYKKKEYGMALTYCELIKADDWRIACTNWLNKRKEKQVAT